MAIYKSKHAGNYTTIPNQILKSGLSLEAIGLLAYLLSLPKDWVVYKTQLHNQLSVGRDKLDRVFNELRDLGYVISVEKRGIDGKIEYEHVVYDIPYNGEPHTEKPFTEKPSAANPQLQSTNIQNTNILNKEIKKSVVDIWWDDLQNCSHLDDIARNNKVTRDKVVAALPDFRPKMDVSYKSFTDMVNHFKNFFVLSLKNKNQQPTVKKRTPLI